MTVPLHNPITFDRRELSRLGARLILAHLEEDADMRGFYVDLVRHESGLDAEAFELADATAELFARGYNTPETRERARTGLTTYLEQS